MEFGLKVLALRPFLAFLIFPKESNRPGANVSKHFCPRKFPKRMWERMGRYEQTNESLCELYEDIGVCRHHIVVTLCMRSDMEV